jgi:hypothetical protein
VKKSRAIQLTLVSALALSAAACSSNKKEEGDWPEQSMRGYCDPNKPEVCQQQPRAGFVPMFIPMYWGGHYYDNRGVARTRPGGAVVVGAPKPAISRGGFGRTGTVRGSSGRGVVGA